MNLSQQILLGIGFVRLLLKFYVSTTDGESTKGEGVERKSGKKRESARIRRTDANEFEPANSYWHRIFQLLLEFYGSTGESRKRSKKGEKRGSKWGVGWRGKVIESELLGGTDANEYEAWEKEYYGKIWKYRKSNEKAMEKSMKENNEKE
jgi:hypothetical protein